MVRPLKIKNNQGKIKANVIIPMHQGDKIMKKPLSIILTIILIISIVGNIVLYLQLNKVNTENRDLNNSIVEIQDSISDLENQLSDVQEQLSNSTAKNEELQKNNDSLQSELEQLQSEVEKLQLEKSLSLETSNNRDFTATISSNQGNTSNSTSSNSPFNQDNVGDILNNLFGEGGSPNGMGNGQGLKW